MPTTDDSYLEIFSRRAASYDKAMREYPDARADEFRALLAWVEYEYRQTILDIPSGAGYLARYVDTDSSRLIHIDPSRQFVDLSRHWTTAAICQSRPDKLPLPTASIDTIISLVGLHHEAERSLIFAEWRRIIKPHGKLLIAEVEDNSAIAAFLNGFVHRHTALGHQGRFIDQQFLTELTDTGWKVTRSELTDSHWRFQDRPSMLRYFRLFFDLQADDTNIAKGLSSHFEILETEEGLRLKWPLRQLSLALDT